MFTKSMWGMIEKRSLAGVHHLTPVHPRDAQGLLEDLYTEIRNDFMLVSPLLLHSPVPELLAGTWSALRETLLVGRVPRAYKEAVAAAVSKLNTCPFCVEAHAMSVHAAAGKELASAVERGESAAIEDPKMRALMDWASATRSPGSPVLLDPPFSSSEAPEIIGTALCFHYVNRMVNVFCDRSPLPLPSVLSGLKGFLRGVSAPMLREVVEATPEPGASLSRLPRAELPQDLGWAFATPRVAGAFAGFAALLERYAARHVSEAVRSVVHRAVEAWNGEEPELGRAWVDRIVAPLEEKSRAASRLALLTALASFQVDENAIAAFRAEQPEDPSLLVLTSWASLTATRRISSWLPLPAFPERVPLHQDAPSISQPARLAVPRRG